MPWPGFEPGEWDPQSHVLSKQIIMPWPGFEPGEWDPQSHVLSKLHHQG